MKPPVSNPRRGSGGSSNGPYTPNGSGPPQRYIPMQRLELAGLRRSVLVALAIAFLIPVAVAVWAISQLGSSKSNHTVAAGSGSSATAGAAAPASHAQTQPALLKAVTGVNGSMNAQGMLPPSACKSTSSTMVTCTQPVQAVNTVTFRTYPSLKALYAAYMDRAMALSGGKFHTNYGNCTEVLTTGERSWNHNVQHPIKYAFSMFPSGQISDDQAAGRLFCTFGNDQLHLVWTQNDGRLLGELNGAPHYEAYVWWRQVHHEIALPGSPGMSMQDDSKVSKMSQTSTTMSGMSK